MARIRTVKPEFFTSEDIVELEPLARLLYIALWCEADKEGRFAWKPKTFKMRYLPADTCDIESVCDALVTRRLIVLYGDGLAVIPSFKNHQHINPREKESAYPAPNPEDLTRAPRVAVASLTGREEGRKEGREREGKELLSGQNPDVAGQDDAGGHEGGEPPKPRRQASEEDYTCARKLFGISLNVNPQAKKPNFDTWANEVRLMREQDKRTHDEIEALFNWARRDGFWGPNIQSPAKLREKWDMLTERRKNPDRRANGRPSMNSFAQPDLGDIDPFDTLRRA